AEKRRRDDAFAIITLVFADAAGKTGTVPELLEPYVWKQPSSDLQGLREILRALPKAIGKIGPAPGVPDHPNVKVKLSAATLQTFGAGHTKTDVLMVRLENHDSRPIYV